jgi:hypothetical protein
MNRSRATYICSLVVAILLVFTSLLHLVNINDTIVALKTGDISKAYESDIIIIWVFAGMCMLLIGIWLFFLAPELKELNLKAWWQAFVIGSALSIFGLLCWLKYPRLIYVLYFMMLGLIVLLPLVLHAGRFMKKKKQKQVDA